MEAFERRGKCRGDAPSSHGGGRLVRYGSERCIALLLTGDDDCSGPTTSELESALLVAGLGEWAPKLAQLARHCIILVPGPIEEGANAPRGACRLGGEPDMPPDIDWPTRPPIIREAGYPSPYLADIMLGRWHWLHWLFATRRWRDAIGRWERSQRAERDVRNRTWPLSFIAQVDFAEVHAAQALDGFPPGGRLLFFCDPFDWPWGKREDRRRARRLHRVAGRALGAETLATGVR